MKKSEHDDKIRSWLFLAAGICELIAAAIGYFSGDSIASLGTNSVLAVMFFACGLIYKPGKAESADAEEKKES